MTESTPPPTPAGWYPDPANPAAQRYWDGRAWTASAPAPSPAPTTSTNAVIGLVLAILSWVICPIIAAIAALVLARASTKEIEASQGRVGGAGLNTATRIIAWINIGVSIVAGLGVVALIILYPIISSNVASGLDPEMNSRTGLADGQYSLNPSRRAFFGDECSYGGTVSIPGNPDVGDVDLYGTGPTECPNLVEVMAVQFEVRNGVARIISVQ